MPINHTKVESLDDLNDLKMKSSGQINEWLIKQSKKDTLRFLTCGSVDDGKSTLIGRLLFDSKQVFEDHLSALYVDSKKIGTQGDEIDYALLVDGLNAEREQGITIDVAYRYFSTSNRKFIVADTPGHDQYTRNMITGASNADVAVLLIDARQGVRTQTIRHAFLVSLVGIRQVILAINKMDLVDYNHDVFNKIVYDFTTLADSFSFSSITSIPLSALKGDNITTRSINTSWYVGPTLMGCLETIEIHRPCMSNPVFPVQWVNRPNDGFRGYSGTLVAGELRVGEILRVTTSGQTAVLTRVLNPDRDAKMAIAGDAVTLVFDRELDISRGDVISSSAHPLEMTDQFEATLVWMSDIHGLIGRVYEIKLSNQWTSAHISKIKYRINVNNQGKESCTKLESNDIAVVNLTLSKSLVFTPYDDCKELGGFLLIDKFSHATLGAGMIRHNLRRAINVHRQDLAIRREDRERLNGHKGKVIWFTGLSGSGKSTLANALEKEFHSEGKRTYILDGDNIRQGLNKDLGFTDADRVENIRRAAEVARLMMDSGMIVLTSFISPFRAEREMARNLIGSENFIEVFVDVPLSVCEERDPKGLYRKARNGLLPNLTGIGSPYEPPLNPSYVVKHDGNDVHQASQALFNFLSKLLT